MAKQRLNLDPKHFAKFVRYWRERRNLTQGELANLASDEKKQMYQTAISSIEHGAINIGVDRKRRIEKALGAEYDKGANYEN